MLQLDVATKDFLRLACIVSTAGKVLFNGDPTDELFWETLKQIEAGITRPEAAALE